MKRASSAEHETGARRALARARAPEPGNYSSAQYQLTEHRNVPVSMRDGFRLSVDIYAPQSPEKLPGILAITPYDNNGLRTEARWFACRGYVVVAADSRGRYDSEGCFDPFDAKHKTDGYDLVEWMAEQTWSNGKIGMMGGSYAGWAQWWTASLAPPHLAAIVPKVAPPDGFENIPYQNGVLTGGYFIDWCAMMAGRTAQAVDDGQYGGWRARYEELKQTPYIDVNVRRGIHGAPWFQELYRRNKATDPYWQAISYQGQENYSRMTVPSLGITGWFDVNHPGTPMNYIGMKNHAATAAARRPSMIIGPWAHETNRRSTGGLDYGPDATFDAGGYVTRWFDHFLKGVDNGVERDPPVYVFVMGENRWHAEQDWPLPHAKPTKYYFNSHGRANSLKGDGILATTLPASDAMDSYTYDPRTPTRGPLDNYADFNLATGPVDTRISSIGDDVLVYQTPPLQSAVEVTGPIEAILFASTSARDTDWFVRLVDVHPDGRSFLLTEGATRARNRDPARDGDFNPAQLSTIEPGKVCRYVIRFCRGTANLFKQGHRIRVEISSSWFPYYLPNLNVGADNLAQVSIADAVVARQTIHHGPQYPSHILLPVIPDRTAGTE